MKEVIHGIYQLQLPMGDFPPGYTNAYLVQGDNKYLLIDTGWDTKEMLASLKKQLDEIGISFKDIAQIVLTHSHTDHAGMASRLKRLSHAQIYLHKLEADIIKSRFIYTDNLCRDKFLQKTDQLLRTHGMPANELAEPQTLLPRISLPPFPDITLKGGETISAGPFNFQVLWTPGHSPGHISLYEPTQKILFSGDLILPTITSSVGLHLQHSGNPLDDYLNSLNVIKRLEVNFVLPGHEHPFTNLPQRIEELTQHHKQKNTEILETIANGKPKTAYQISLAMSWLPDTNEVGWHNLSQWEKRFAVLETVAHLESIRASGKVNRASENSAIYYHAT